MTFQYRKIITNMFFKLTPPREILPKSILKNLESTSPSDGAFGLSLSPTVISKKVDK